MNTALASVSAVPDECVDDDAGEFNDLDKDFPGDGAPSASSTNHRARWKDALTLLDCNGAVAGRRPKCRSTWTAVLALANSVALRDWAWVNVAGEEPLERELSKLSEPIIELHDAAIAWASAVGYSMSTRILAARRLREACKAIVDCKRLKSTHQKTGEN